MAALATPRQTVLTTTAALVARATGAVPRPSKRGGAALVQPLVVGWRPAPPASWGQRSQLVAPLGIDVTPHGRDPRVPPPLAEWLAQVVAVAGRQVVAVAGRQVVASAPVALPLRQRCTAVTGQDRATIAWPAVTGQDRATIAWPAVFASQWRGRGQAPAPAARTAARKVPVR